MPLLLLGIAGATALSVLSGRPGGPAAGAVPVTVDARPETLEPASGDWLAGCRPALEILAGILGVQGEVSQMKLDAHATAEALRLAAGAEPAREAADELASQLGGFSKESEGAARRLAILSAPSLQGPAAASRQQLVDELFRAQETRSLLEAVKGRLLRDSVALETVIVTMPDYVDSYSAWFFDRNLDGVQRAAGAARFVLDRFHLPDWDPASATGTPKGERHRSEPAVILFREQDDAEQPEKRRLLLVLMPLETATAGIHKGAFLSAVGLANELSQGETLRVLGPSFSGSRFSLRLALQSALDQGLVPARPDGVTIRSGSATSPANKKFLEGAYCGPSERGSRCTTDLVAFDATTVSDDDTQAALADFLGTINARWESGAGVAILHEANTTFGQGFAKQGFAKQIVSEPEPSRPKHFPDAVRVAYPLHISRLRTHARDRSTSTRPTHLFSPGTVSFRLDDPTVPQDQLPPVRAEATAAVVQTALATILDQLERARVRAVGLYGTDDRDKIFLAEHIRYRSPNVQLFTIEGGLAYLHPETRAFVRGTILAASYPLFSGTQHGEMPLHQFHGVGAEGIYNALLTLLDEEEGPAGERRLLDYASEDCDVRQPVKIKNNWRCGPGVWISVIGRNAVWPIQRYGLAARNEGYTWLPEQPPAREAVRPAFRVLTASLAPGTARASAAQMAGADTQRSAEGAESRRPPPHWPSSTVLACVVVVVMIVVHGLGLVSAAVLLGFGPRFGRGAIARRIEPRLRRYAPWLEPPERCAERWRRREVPPAAGDAAHSGETTPLDLARSSALRQEYWLSQLACAGALLAAGSWLSQTVVPGLAPETARAAVRGAMTGARVGLSLAFVVGAAALVWPTRARRDAGLLPLMALRWVPVLIGCVALFCLQWWLAVGEVWSSPEAVYNVQRLVEARSMVSPTVPVLALSLAVYLWGAWNLWRVHEQAIEFGEGAAVVAVLRADQPAAARRFGRVLDDPQLSVGLPAAVVLGVLVALEVLAAVGLDLHMHSADGEWMAWLLLTGTVLVSFLVCHTLAHGLRQGRALLDALGGLNLAPIGRAFAGLGAETQLWQLSAGLPRAREAHVLVQQVRATARAFGALAPNTAGDDTLRRPSPPAERTLASGARGDWTPRLAEPGPASAPDAIDYTLARQLQVRPPDVVELRWGPKSATAPAREEEERRPLHASVAWQEIERWSEHLVRVLARGPWGRRTRVGSDPAPADEPHLRAAEGLLALQVAFSVRFALVRLMSVFALAVTGLLLLLCAHLFYSFQSRAFWLGVDWSLLGLATASILYLLVRLERNAVLSHLWRSEPGRLNWKDQLVHRIFVYGAIPVITAFMTFFPEVGTTLFSWFEPIKKSLP